MAAPRSSSSLCLLPLAVVVVVVVLGASFAEAQPSPTPVGCCCDTYSEDPNFPVNPECCIIGTDPNSCAELKWDTGKCFWRDDCKDVKPSPTPSGCCCDTYSEDPDFPVNPECCIIGTDPNSCEALQWNTGKCFWRDDCKDVKPTPSPSGCCCDTVSNDPDFPVNPECCANGLTADDCNAMVWSSGYCNWNPNCGGNPSRTPSPTSEPEVTPTPSPSGCCCDTVSNDPDFPVNPECCANGLTADDCNAMVWSSGYCNWNPNCGGNPSRSPSPTSEPEVTPTPSASGCCCDTVSNDPDFPVNPECCANGLTAADCNAMVWSSGYCTWNQNCVGNPSRSLPLSRAG